MPNNKNPKYDLEERTAKFGEEVIKFANKIPKNPITISIIGQLVDAGTSVGANYCEADDAESKEEARILWQEAKKLNLIFNSITNKSKNKVS
ncbi:four helix bundle protein, partial [Candidatus Shapirobacteria bacterium CG07_land_8_20_14_0_80_39_18]